MWQLVNLRTDSIYLLHIYFNLRTVTGALVVVYITDNSSRSVAIKIWRGRTSAKPYSK